MVHTAIILDFYNVGWLRLNKKKNELIGKRSENENKREGQIERQREEREREGEREGVHTAIILDYYNVGWLLLNKKKNELIGKRSENKNKGARERER